MQKIEEVKIEEAIPSTDYKCPYCGKSNFKHWKSVRAHMSMCKSNTKEYVIDEYYGSISISEVKINYFDRDKFKLRFPKLHSKIWNLFASTDIRFHNKKFDKQSIITSIKNWYSLYGTIPQARGFDKAPNFPSSTAVIRYFGSWNNAIEAAGFTPNIQNGFGIDTPAKDGHFYRSKAEAYFVDNFLFEKYEYIVEPKYPNEIWMYDFYLPELDLYIEIDGGLRPERMQEKTAVNKLLGRNLLVISTTDLYKEDFGLGVIV